MKRLFTLFLTLVVAWTLTVPVYAAQGAKKETAKSAEHSKAHKEHSKKKGASKGKKEGQEGTNPSADKTKK